MIPPQYLSTIELFSSFKPVLKKHFILKCSNAIIKLFCNCVFNIQQGSIELQNVKIQSLKKRWRSLRSFARRKLDWFWKEHYWLRNHDSVSCKFWTVQLWDIWNCKATSSKATKRIVLVPADVYFAEARRHLVGLHSFLVLDPSEPKRLSSHNKKLDMKLLKKSAESQLETTNKTTQLNILDRLKQRESNEKNGKSDSSVSVSNKIQAVITKLTEIGWSSSKLERSRVTLQACFKNSRLSLNELLDIQLNTNATELNPLTFWSVLQVPNKKLSESALNVLRLLQVNKHIISNFRGKDVAQQFSTSVSWIERF